MPRFATTIALNSPKVGPKSLFALCGKRELEDDKKQWLLHLLGDPSSNILRSDLLDEITNMTQPDWESYLDPNPIPDWECRSCPKNWNKLKVTFLSV